MTYELIKGPNAAPRAPLAITAEVKPDERQTDRQIATVTGQMGPAAMPTQKTSIVTETGELQNDIATLNIIMPTEPAKSAGQRVHRFGRASMNNLPIATPPQNTPKRHAAELAGMLNFFSKYVLTQQAVDISTEI